MREGLEKQNWSQAEWKLMESSAYSHDDDLLSKRKYRHTISPNSRKPVSSNATFPMAIISLGWIWAEYGKYSKYGRAFGQNPATILEAAVAKGTAKVHKGWYW